MWVVIIDSSNPSALFAEINMHQKAHNGNQKLREWLCDNNAVSVTERTLFKNMLETVGINLVKKVAYTRPGYNIRTYQQACRIARYCQQAHNTELIKDALAWLIENKQTMAARSYMEQRKPAVKLLWAIHSNKVVASEKLTINKGRVTNVA